MIKAESVESFLEQLASKSATPGGGGAAAVSGAMGAALLSMVINLTLGKRGYEKVQDEFTRLLEETERLRASLVDAIQEDVEVFNRVMAAYRMPKEGDAEQAARSDELQTALQEATRIPLRCAELCRQVMLHSRVVAGKGSTMVISDAGVGVMAAYAGLMSAALNVQINLAAIKDEDFASAHRQRLHEVLDGADALRAEVYALVESRL